MPPHQESPRKKLRLQLDDRRVHSFSTTSAEKEKGTVFGEQCTCYTNCTCPGCPTCYASCNGTCAGTCEASCNGTCAGTCEASCNGTCNATACGTCDYSCDGTCAGASCYNTCNLYSGCGPYDCV